VKSNKEKINPMELIIKKSELFSMYGEELTDSEKERALRDFHARRPPRWCGLTVHVTINCPFQCAYCYIEDMGFKFDGPRPYPLSSKELVYAILSNPCFLPSRHGTLIAIGAVSEPFIFPSKALEYLRELAKLGNPIQFSTKQYISKNLAEKIASIAIEYNTPISPLITIITMQKYDILERFAPPPEKRLDSIKNLRDAGLKPVLFLRPLIPGINLDEIEDILEAAKDSGAVGVVIGGFRVTRRIINRLESLGLNTVLIKERLKIIDEKQRNVPLPEKKIAMNKAKKKGLITWASTCCANSWNANVPCPSACFIDGPCTKCPNFCSYPADTPNASEVIKALQELNINAKIKGPRVLMLNYPFKGADMLVRNISRRSVKVVKKFKRSISLASN